MKSKSIEALYFRWLVKIIDMDRFSDNLKYNELLHLLFLTPFVPLMDADRCRVEDGITLRTKFACDAQIDTSEYGDPLYFSPVEPDESSVLELMVALASRCEDHIMADPDYGNRTGQWFWYMISSLGLGRFTDAYFADHPYMRFEVEEIMYDFLNRSFSFDGSGSLFRIKNTKYDLREVDIWTQMCWYLDSFS